MNKRGLSFVVISVIAVLSLAIFMGAFAQETPEKKLFCLDPPGGSGDYRFFIDESGVVRGPTICPAPLGAIEGEPCDCPGTTPSPTGTPEPTDTPAPTPSPTPCVVLPNGEEVGFSAEQGNRYAYFLGFAPPFDPCPTPTPTE